MRFGDGQAASGAPGIVESRDNGEERGGIQGEGAEHDQRARRKYLADQDGEERQDLCTGTCFAINAGAEVAHPEADIEEGRDDEDTKIAAKHQDGHASRDELLMHEHKKERAEEELVGDRIEVLTDLGLLLEHPGSKAIQAVTKAGDDKETECCLVMGLQHGDDQKGDDAQAKERKQVGRCAQFFQQGCFRPSWLQPRILMVHALLV
jgi:hypothetical protein